MEITDKPTCHMLIKAHNNSEWDNCGFAIVSLSPEWQQIMEKRLEALRPFQNDEYFYSQVYWDAPVNYFVNLMTRLTNSWRAGKKTGVLYHSNKLTLTVSLFLKTGWKPINCSSQQAEMHIIKPMVNIQAKNSGLNLLAFRPY